MADAVAVFISFVLATVADVRCCRRIIRIVPVLLMIVSLDSCDVLTDVDDSTIDNDVDGDDFSKL